MTQMMRGTHVRFKDDSDYPGQEGEITHLPGDEGYDAANNEAWVSFLPPYVCPRNTEGVWVYKEEIEQK